MGEVERFVQLIRRQTGNVVPLARHCFLGELLARRTRATGAGSATAYLDALARGESREEWGVLVPLVTIKESYFFRAPQQFAALERLVLPEIVRRRVASRRLRVWSAACARGEETGTLAILLAESRAVAGWEWEIVGTDVDEEALAAARRGLYGERAVAHVPPALLERWFRPRGALYELAPELTGRIVYRPVNLAHPPYEAVREAAGEPFDLILLRNVLIYFGRPLQRRVVTLVANALAAHGALFLGASETLWQIQDRLVAYDLGACFCYRHRPAGEDAPLLPFPGASEAPAGDPQAARPLVVAARHAGATPSAPDAPDAPEAPVTGRPVAEGLPSSPAAAVPPGTAAGASAEGAGNSGGGSLGETLEHQLDLDATRPRIAPCGIQERLAGIAAAVAAERFAAAAADLDALLAADPSEPAAHALDGFLHDLRSEPEAATSSYRAALYLDPALFQVRLLLANLLRRQGHRRRSDHEYREVLATVERGQGRSLPCFALLPLPDREGAERRCRLALG